MLKFILIFIDILPMFAYDANVELILKHDRIFFSYSKAVIFSNRQF